jgi:hypothetical protein
LSVQPVIVIACINHDAGAILGIEEDVGNPFTNAGDMVVNATGVQPLEDFLAAVDARHTDLLETGVLTDKDGRSSRVSNTSQTATKVSPMFHPMSFRPLLNRLLSTHYKI